MKLTCPLSPGFALDMHSSRCLGPGILALDDRSPVLPRCNRCCAASLHALFVRTGVRVVDTLYRLYNKKDRGTELFTIAFTSCALTPAVHAGWPDSVEMPAQL